MKPATPPPATPPSATPPPATPPPAPPAGRGRGGSGFASSESTPLVVDGVTVPVARRTTASSRSTRRPGKEKLGVPAALRQPVDARPRVLARRRQHAGADRLRHERRQALLDRRQRPASPTRRSASNGVVNLDTPEILRGLPGRNGLTSPPIVYKHLVITGGTTQENPPRGPAGDVRAWDMHTGKLVWTFRSVPQAGERFNETWAGDSWKNRSGVNVWGFITVDAARGIVYMPFGAPSVDQYGGDRAGDNLFGTSLVAADANTGKYLWHFQLDASRHLGRRSRRGAGAARRHARRQGRSPPSPWSARSGLLFLLDRTTGKPHLRRRGAAGAAERGAARAGREDAAVPARAAAAVAHEP